MSLNHHSERYVLAFQKLLSVLSPDEPVFVLTASCPWSTELMRLFLDRNFETLNAETQMVLIEQIEIFEKWRNENHG